MAYDDNPARSHRRPITRRYDGETHVHETEIQHFGRTGKVAPASLCLQHTTGYFATGALASVVSRTATAPLDRLKIYFICQTANPATSSVSSGRRLAGVAHAASSVWMQSTRNIWRVGGIRSLWSGNGLNIVKMVPEGATKFGVYEVGGQQLFEHGRLC